MEPIQLLEEPKGSKLDQAESNTRTHLDSATHHLAKLIAQRPVTMGTVPNTPKAHQEWEFLGERLKLGLNLAADTLPISQAHPGQITTIQAKEEVGKDKSRSMAEQLRAMKTSWMRSPRSPSMAPPTTTWHKEPQDGKGQALGEGKDQADCRHQEL